MNIYIASYFDTRARLYPYRERLVKAGHVVTSGWLDVVFEAPAGMTQEAYYKQGALRDLQDIARSSLFIIDTLDVTPRGGREVELGYAFVVCEKTVLIGPKRNVFHELVDRAYPDWDSFFKEALGDRDNTAMPAATVGETYTAPVCAEGGQECVGVGVGAGLSDGDNGGGKDGDSSSSEAGC